MLCHVGRWGGDEYIVVAPDTTLTDGVVERVQAVLARSRSELIVAGHPISFSAGVPSNGPTPKETLSAAHLATMEAKRTKATIKIADTTRQSQPDRP